MKKLISKIASFFKNKKNTEICDCDLDTLIKGQETKLETGIMCDYYCHHHNMTTLALKAKGHIKDVDLHISDNLGHSDHVKFSRKTMNDVYGDKTSHLACENCGYCLTCNDCYTFGCGKKRI